jgi:hypothetical protein
VKIISIATTMLLVFLSMSAIGTSRAAAEASGASFEITATVANGSDDGFSGSWGHFNKTVWYDTGNPGEPFNAWFRFSDVTIPDGASIEGAYLETIHGGWGSGVNLQIAAEYAPSPSVPTGNADYNSKSRAAVAINWASGYGDWTGTTAPILPR